MKFSSLNKFFRAGIVLFTLGGCTGLYSGGSDEALTETLILAATAAEDGGDYATAAVQYRTLRERRPDNREILLGLARNLRYTGRAKLAANELLNALGDGDATGDVLLELAKAEIAKADAEAAIGHLQSAIKKKPGDWDVFNTLGVGFDLLKSYDKAQEAYAKALSLSPGNFSVINNNAISLALSGEIEAAISSLEDASISVRRTPQVRQNLALFYALKGDLKKAKSLAEMDLSKADLRNNLAVFNRLRRQQNDPSQP